MARKEIPFVDLFCGAGGLSAGFEKAGFTSVYANDYDKYACETYELNHRNAYVHCGDVEELSGKAILEKTQLSSVPLVIGGPNCQGVSLRGLRDPNDPKNKAFYNFVRLVNELQPEWFVMENVPGLMHKHNRELAASIFKEFSSIGYNCGAEVLLAADYGVPQLRYRLIIIGNRTGLPICFPDQTHFKPFRKNNDLLQDAQDGPYWRTTRDAIFDLDNIDNGGGEPYVEYDKAIDDLGRLGLDKEYIKYLREGAHGISNHVCHKTSDSNIELIKHIPQGGNWRNIPEEIRPPRFKKVALKDHTTTYGRLNWDMPSRTVTTYFNNISSGAFTHPIQNRGISVREGARLQSFPDSFVFKGTLARQYRQVGNAVPPLLAYHVASPIYDILSGSIPENLSLHGPAIEYNEVTDSLEIKRPLQGMRFNLDKHLVTGGRSGRTNDKRSTAVG